MPADAPELLSTETSGLPAAKDTPVMVFMAGFPDDHGTWEEIAPRFSKSHTIVTLCMPDYDQQKLNSFWGYSFDRIVSMLAASVDHAVSDEQEAEVILVAHDWGAYIAYLYLEKLKSTKTKVQIDKFVVLDVGMFKPKQMSKPIMLTIACYQTFLALVFIISRFVPFDALADLLLILYPWKLIGPCPHEHPLPKRTSPGGDGLGRGVHSWMGYPYFYMITGALTGSSQAPKFPTMPTLYIYGKRKRAMFHSAQFLAKLDKQGGSAWREFDCGHFIQVQKPDELEKEMRTFLGLA